MKSHYSLPTVALAVGLSTMYSTACAQTPTPSPSQQILAQAAEQRKFTYIVFYRDDDAATRAMAQTVADGIAKRSALATAAYVQISNPADYAVVEQYSVSRAPMPLTLAVAPNGAITGAFPQSITDEALAGALVTPAMTHCMKGMQDGKLVFLCVQTTPQVLVPQGLAEFLADPQFKDRANVVPVQATDPAEAQLLAELELGAAQPNQPNTVFFAPPGVLVGKFGPASTKAEIAAALHKAGKCCEDPNCKHGHAAKPGGSVR